MAESLFSSAPRSLRMDRNSPEAAKLREAVSKKLFDFLGSYSDEVLAEYIVVLVCNGKHQTQARDDLHAFLGEESGAFVAWLWNYLSEEFITEVTPEVSDPEAKGTTKNNRSLDREFTNNMPPADHHSLSIGPPKMKDGSFELPYSHANSDHLKPNQVSERHQPRPSSLNERSTEVNTERLKVFDTSLQTSSGSKGGNFIVPAKDNTLSIKDSHEVISVSKQNLQNRKIKKYNATTVPSQQPHEPKTEQTAIGLRSVITEEHQLRPLSCTNSADRMMHTTTDDLPHQTAPLRGNVWDRLGRPRVQDQRLIKEERPHHIDFIDGGKVDTQGVEHQNPILTRISPVTSSTSSLNRHSYGVDRGDMESISVKLSDDCRSEKVDSTSHLKRRIEVGELYSSNDTNENNYLQDKKHSQRKLQSLPIKQKSQQNMNKFARIADKSVLSDGKLDLINTADMEPASKAIVVSNSLVKKDSVTTPMNNLPPVITTSPANLSQSKKDGGHAIQKPIKDDMLAVKSKLQQIEMDMLKLRSKQVVRSTDGKQNVSSVVQTPTEESIESRTVLVANVHFAATKESLISHFGKCGFIAKVIMLTDAVTGLPKGAAYIVFANKESVEKAISLNGTSFFSRILKVIRKVEVPPDYLVPSQPTLKQQQQNFPSPYGKNPVQKPHASSHLQWRRDQRSSGDNTLTASSNGLGSSNSVD